MNKKFVILLHGPMGSGKTTVSKKINELVVPSARVALPDVRRFVSGNHRESGELARKVMFDMTESYLKNDISVVIDVVCKADYIEECKQLAQKYGYIFLPYYIFADSEVRWSRVCARTAEMMGVEVLPKSKIQELEPIFAHNKEFYVGLTGELGEHLDSTTLTVDEVVTKIESAV